eukprot:243002_1
MSRAAAKTAENFISEIPKRGRIGWGKNAIEINLINMVVHERFLPKKERIPKDQWLLKKGDFIEVVNGDIKGQRGKILQCFYAQNRILVEGVNLHKGEREYSRYGALESPDGIYGVEKPLNYADVKLVDPETDDAVSLFLSKHNGINVRVRRDDTMVDDPEEIDIGLRYHDTPNPLHNTSIRAALTRTYWGQPGSDWPRVDLNESTTASEREEWLWKEREFDLRPWINTNHG